MLSIPIKCFRCHGLFGKNYGEYERILLYCNDCYSSYELINGIELFSVSDLVGYESYCYWNLTNHTCLLHIYDSHKNVISIDMGWIPFDITEDRLERLIKFI